MHALIHLNACMKKKQDNIQYTIRSIPPDVNEAVRAYSVREGCSLNQAVLEALRKGSGATDKPIVYHDLDFMSDTWIRDAECEKALEEFDRVDAELWK
jgi:hypothetical protein